MKALTQRRKDAKTQGCKGEVVRWWRCEVESAGNGERDGVWS